MIEFDMSGILHVQPASTCDIVYVQTCSRVSNIMLQSTIETLVYYTDSRVKSVIVFETPSCGWGLQLLLLGWVMFNLESVVSCGYNLVHMVMRRHHIFSHYRLILQSWVHFRVRLLKKWINLCVWCCFVFWGISEILFYLVYLL